MARSALAKAELVDEIEEAVSVLPGNDYEFTQPIQMRFNELIAGVRGDVAVKVYGDDFEPMLRVGQGGRGVLRGIRGAADVKVEQVAGLPCSTSSRQGGDRPARPQRRRRAGRHRRRHRRPGGGRGVRRRPRFHIVVRLPDESRNDLEALGNLPVASAADEAGGACRDRAAQPRRALRHRRRAEPDQPRERQAARGRQANVRGRDIGSVVPRRKRGSRRR